MTDPNAPRYLKKRKEEQIDMRIARGSKSHSHDQTKQGVQDRFSKSKRKEVF